jgi:transposase
MQLRDMLGTIYTDEVFADLFPPHGQPAEAPWRLALVTVFQFMENLTDRQAADAVRDRLAWKYALSLELTDPGFDHTVLSEFRSRLIEGNAEQRLLDLLLERCREGGWLKAGGRQRTDSTHVLAKIRALNRTLCVAQTMVYVLNVLSEVAPDWLLTHIPAEWVERYGERLEHERLPKEEEERKQYANQVGADGWMLLDALEIPETPDWMKTLPAIITLHTIWEQQFEAREQGGQWRQEPALPAAQLINSPYDLDARYGKKRTTLWVGYKVHFSQTCDEDAPQLITHVETTQAPVSDEHALCDPCRSGREGTPPSATSRRCRICHDRQSCPESILLWGEPGWSHPQDALVPSGDWLRPHALLHRLGNRDGYLSTRADQFDLDGGPGCRQITHQGEVFPE